MNDCIFCKIKKESQLKPSTKIIESEYCFLMADEYPVSLGHALIIPNRHVENALYLTNTELNDMYRLTKTYIKFLETILGNSKPDGYNIGFNINEAGGQSVPHAHMHIIPRYKGDVPKPKGGIRGVIPNKQNY